MMSSPKECDADRMSVERFFARGVRRHRRHLLDLGGVRRRLRLPRDSARWSRRAMLCCRWSSPCSCSASGWFYERFVAAVLAGGAIGGRGLGHHRSVGAGRVVSGRRDPDRSDAPRGAPVLVRGPDADRVHPRGARRGHGPDTRLTASASAKGRSATSGGPALRAPCHIRVPRGASWSGSGQGPRHTHVRHCPSHARRRSQTRPAVEHRTHSERDPAQRSSATTRSGSIRSRSSSTSSPAATRSC